MQQRYTGVLSVVQKGEHRTALSHKSYTYTVVLSVCVYATTVHGCTPLFTERLTSHSSVTQAL